MSMYLRKECLSLKDNDYNVCEPEPRDEEQIALLCEDCYAEITETENEQ